MLWDVTLNGLIATTDVDVIALTADTGAFTVTATPAHNDTCAPPYNIKWDSSILDIRLELRSSSNALIASADTDDDLATTLSTTLGSGGTPLPARHSRCRGRSHAQLAEWLLHLWLARLVGTRHQSPSLRGVVVIPTLTQQRLFD